MKLIGRVCISEPAGLSQSHGSSCLPATCTGNQVCCFLDSTLDHGGGGVFQRKAQGWKQNWIFLIFDLSGCAALWKQQNPVKDVTTLAWKTLKKSHEYMKLFNTLLMIISCGTRPESICQWRLQTWAYLIWAVRKCPLVWWDQISISLSLSHYYSWTVCPSG